MLVRVGRGIASPFRAPAAVSYPASWVAFYDPAAIAKTRAERTGASAAVVDGPVGKVFSSIGSNHLTAGTDAGRPTLRSSGGLSWLEFDGNDDSFTFASVLTGVTHVVIGVKTADNDGVFIHHGGLNSAASPHIPVFQIASAAAATTAITTPAVSVNRGVNITTRMALHTAIVVTPMGAPVVVTASGAALTGAAGPAYGGYAAPGSQYRFVHDLYGLILMASPSAGDVALAEDTLAARAGITL